MDDIDEAEQISHRPQKKGRRRKKQLHQTILQQMEFYFSDSNLTKDRFLSNLVKTDPYVDLNEFLKFNKVRSLTDNVNDIAKAVKKSKLLSLSEDLTKICRITPVQERDNIDECTIYVERIPTDITHDGLSKIFSQFGNVQYVSIPKYKHNKKIKGFAFVEFETVEAAQKTLDHFASIGCKLPSQMPPDKLYSVATYTPDENEKDENKPAVESLDEEKPSTSKMETDNVVEKLEEEKLEDVSEQTIENSRKRTLDESITEEETEKKKIKTDEVVEVEVVNNESGIEDTVEEDGNENEEPTEKKRRRRKKKTGNEIDIKEIGLQVLSKREWKRLRNKYLDLQRAKMHSLKAQLYRARFSNQNNATPNDQRNDSENVDKKKFSIELGTVVHLQIPEPCIDLKSFKAELKSYSNDIKFVDVKESSFEAHVRFSNADAAKKFIECPFPATMTILEGEMQKRYIEKAENDRALLFKRCAEKPKLRGRDKLLKKAEKELGKHIRFDEAE